MSATSLRNSALKLGDRLAGLLQDRLGIFHDRQDHRRR